MRKTSPQQGRLPRDVHARERLREAQRQEAHMLAAVYAAEGVLARAHAKRDAALAATSAVVQHAEDQVATAQAALVEVSGVHRAAILLAVDPSDLRKVTSSRSARRTDA
jgi:hypothetical protein